MNKELSKIVEAYSKINEVNEINPQFIELVDELVKKYVDSGKKWNVKMDGDAHVFYITLHSHIMKRYVVQMTVEPVLNAIARIIFAAYENKEENILDSRRSFISTNVERSVSEAVPKYLKDLVSTLKEDADSDLTEAKQVVDDMSRFIAEKI